MVGLFIGDEDKAVICKIGVDDNRVFLMSPGWYPKDMAYINRSFKDRQVSEYDTKICGELIEW